MKTFLKYTAIAAFFFIIGFSYTYHIPQFKIWAIEKLERHSKQNWPARILVEDFNFSILPLGLEIKNIKISPQKTLTKVLDPVHIHEIDAYINFTGILAGKLELSEINIIEPYIKIHNVKGKKKLIDTIKKLTQKKSAKNSPQKNRKVILSKYLNVPIQKFSITRMYFKKGPTHKNPGIELKDFSIQIENKYNSAVISVISPYIFLEQIKDSKYLHSNLALGGKFLIEQDLIYVSALKIKKDTSFLLSTGEIEYDFTHRQLHSLDLKTKTFLDLKSIRKLAMGPLKIEGIPKVRGTTTLQAFIKKSKQSPLVVDSILSAEGLGINQLNIGNLKMKSSYQDKNLVIDIANIWNNSGQIQLNNTNISFRENKKFSSQLKLTNIQLYQFLKNLGIPTAKVWANINTTIPCKGSIKPTFNLSCNGELQLNEFKVKGGDKSKYPIASFDKAQLKGTVNADSNRVAVNTTVILGNNSSANISGKVDYKKGFRFKYKTSKLDFKDLKVVNLDLEGQSQLEGSTSGNSSYAVFDFSLDAKDAWIKDYNLGNFKSNINYKKGNLYFKNTKGTIYTTRYSGNVTLNLPQSRIQANLKFPYIELADLQKAFSRKVNLPFEAFGNGYAEVQLNGPLQFNLLSYNLKSFFKKGHLATEPFESITFNVSSKNGFVKTEQVQLKKNLGTITLTGNANPDGIIDAKLVGQNFALKDFLFFSENELQVSSNLYFELFLNGYILSPQSQFTGRLFNTSISKASVKDSVFDISIKNKSLIGKSNIFGNTIYSEFKIPFEAEQNMKLNIETKDWDFSPLFSLISPRSRHSEYGSRLTGRIALSSPSNWIWNANGQIEATEFYLKRGTKEIFAPTGINITFNKGNMNIHNFQLKGDNTLLEASTPPSDDKINFNLNGKADLSLFSFLTPFLSDLNGVLSISTQIKATPNNVGLIGSAFIERGFLKLVDFPHPMENFSLDMLFNNDRVLLNKFKSQFANGTLSANGSIEIKGFKDFPLDISGYFNNVTLQIPEGFTTEGNGTFNLKGSWFPFLLTANYDISGGEIIRKLSQTNINASNIKRSSFLPAFLSQTSSSPIKLNLKTDFLRGIDVKNELLDVKIKGSLEITGTPDNPKLLGIITTESDGQFYFREVPFDIKTGQIRFTDPNKMNPYIYINATTTVEEKLATRSQNYQIDLLVQGTLEDYAINLSSTPSRDEKDIVSLLALGVTTEDANPAGQQSVYQQSYEIGGALLSRNPLGKELKSKTGFDFQLSSGVDEVSNSPVPKITISKQWSPKIGTSASRAFGDQVTQDLKVKYKLNSNISLVGSWEGRDNSATSDVEAKKESQSILGLDIDYKLEFK